MSYQPPRMPTAEEFAQLQENYRKSNEMVNQLKGTLDAVIAQQRQPAPQQPPAVKHNLKPEVADDIQKIVDAQLGQALGRQQEIFRGAYNQLWDRTDKAEFVSQYGKEAYNEYGAKIEALREQKARQGQPITRDEAYKYVHFDETGKKPKVEVAPPAPPQPVWDPYLQKYTLPEKAQAPQPQAQAQQPPVQNPGQQPPAQQPPVEAQQQAPAPQDDFTLPPQGQMKSTVATPAASNGPINLDVGSDAATLTAFESKYGDVPL